MNAWKNEALFCNKTTDYLPLINGNGKSEELPIRDLCALSSYVARYQFPAFSVMVDYEDSVFFTPGENRKFKVKVVNSNTMREQQWVKSSCIFQKELLLWVHLQQSCH